MAEFRDKSPEDEALIREALIRHENKPKEQKVALKAKESAIKKANELWERIDPYYRRGENPPAGLLNSWKALSDMDPEIYFKNRDM